MLHSQSRKDCKKSYRAIMLTASAFITTMLMSCNLGNTASEEMANERFNLLNDSAQAAQSCLEEIIAGLHDTINTDKMVCDYYRDGGTWMWVTSDTMSLQAADSVSNYLQKKALEMGFSPQAFFVDSIKHQLAHIHNLDFDSTGTSVPQVMATLELATSKAYLRYAIGQRYGFTEPHRLLNHRERRSGGGYRIVYDIATEQPDSTFIRAAWENGGNNAPTEFLETCETSHPVYAKLKTMLPSDSTDEGRKRILCNMERLRWRHVNAISDGERHVFVNIPSQQLWAIDTDSTFSMRICCGAWATKTPLLDSKIRLIQLNPEWNIPGTILRSEVSPHAGDSAYFARHRYFIINRSTGDTVAAKNVTTAQLRSGAYRVAQHKGRGNSLGRIIFRFNNQFDVYLHDTNSPSAFNRDRRTISHGCVRVQRPFDLAMFMLPDADPWLLDRMRMNIDMAPQTQKGKNYKRQHANDPDPIAGIKMNSTSVNPTVPLIIDYYTLYPNPETGQMETWPDRYEYDLKIADAIKPFLP